MKERERSSQVRRLREHPSAATRSPFPNGEGLETRIPLFSTQRLSQGGRQRGGGFAAQKGSQPRLAALGSPFQGKGLAWTLPPSYGRRCPEGAEVGWGKRYEREGDHLKYAVCESTLSTADAVPLPQWGRLRYENTAFLDTTPFPRGKAAIRGCRFSRIVKANTGYMEKKNNDGQSLPRVGKVASKASRIGF